MVLTKRIIPCLDVDHGRVVKGINFQNLADAGAPADLARRYSEEGADEIVFLDITASSERRDILKEVVRKVAEEINIPFTVGGGIRSVADARIILCNGADKVSINTAAIEKPQIITELSRKFGRQCIVVAIDAKREYHKKTKGDCKVAPEGRWFQAYTYGGRKATGLDPILWAEQAERAGAGEILLTSMDRDGTEEGYDLDLLKAIAERVNIPLIASGGAGRPEHFVEAFKVGGADAALAASVFHYNKYPIPFIKKFLSLKGVDVRL